MGMYGGWSERGSINWQFALIIRIKSFFFPYIYLDGTRT